MYALSTDTQAGNAWAPAANDRNERQVLLLHRNPRELDSLSGYLADHGYATYMAEEAGEVDAILRDEQIDLIILNAGGAADDGLELCRRLAGPGQPSLIVAGSFDSTDRILALELGADDYMATPYNPRELLARMKAVLRRRTERRLPPPAPGRRYFLGFKFDFGSPVLRRVDGGSPVTLTPGEFALLTAFLTNPGKVMSREELLEMARGETADVFDRVIDVQVSRLRQKLAPYTDTSPIRTHRHAGYQFVADVA